MSRLGLEEVDKNLGHEAVAGGVALDDALDPLLVVGVLVHHHYHLAHPKRQLVVLVGITVVQGDRPTWLRLRDDRDI